MTATASALRAIADVHNYLPAAERPAMAAEHPHIADARRELQAAQDRLTELLYTLCPGPHSQTPNFCQACGYSQTGMPRPTQVMTGSRFD